MNGDLPPLTDECGSGAGCLYKDAMLDTLQERVRVLREALELAMKWGAALCPAEYAKCRAALEASK